MVVLALALSAEPALDRLIEAAYGDDWPSSLAEGRLEKAREVFDARRRTNTEIGLLQCLMLTDRMTLICKKQELRKALGFANRKSFETLSSHLSQLRDTLAHGGNLLQAEGDVGRAVDLVGSVRSFAEGVWNLADELESADRPTSL